MFEGLRYFDLGNRGVIVNARCDSLSTTEITVNELAAAFPWGSLTSAVTLEAVSSNAADAAAGTGARTIRVEGLDSNYREQAETVTLNGTSAVALANSYLRINAVRVSSVGSGGSNVGTITIRLTGAGTNIVQIAAGYNQLHHGVYTVPAGKTGLIVASRHTRSLTTASTFAIYKRLFGEAFCLAYYSSINGAVTPSDRQHLPPIVLPEKTDIDLRGSNASSGIMTADVGILLKGN